MTLRTGRERVLQTLAYEAGGLILATPAYAMVFGAGTGESVQILVALSVAVLVWAPLHNTVFDWVDWQRTGRVASDRRTRGRLFHALSLEVSALAVTCPLVKWLAGVTLADALLVNLGLTLFYMAYAFIFHVVFDRMRPVGQTKVRKK